MRPTQSLYSVGLGWGPQSNISNKFSGDADAATAVATRWERLTKPAKWQLFTLSLPTSKHCTSLFQRRQWPQDCLMPAVIITHNWAEFQFQEPPQISTISSSRTEVKSTNNRENSPFRGFSPSLFFFLFYPLLQEVTFVLWFPNASVMEKNNAPLDFSCIFNTITAFLLNSVLMV